MSTTKWTTPTSWKIRDRRGVEPADLGDVARHKRRAELVALLERSAELASVDLVLDCNDNTSALELLETCSKAAELARGRLA